MVAMVKVCFKCGSEKTLTEFYPHPRMRDGRLNKCKECARRDVREHYSGSREQIREYERRRAQLLDRKSKVSEYQRKRRQLHPEQYRASHAVCNAVRDGRLVRQPCEICGATPAQGHHEDYSRPLDVRWLCFFCHRTHGHGQKHVARR